MALKRNILLAKAGTFRNYGNASVIMSWHDFMMILYSGSTALCPEMVAVTLGWVWESSRNLRALAQALFKDPLQGMLGRVMDQTLLRLIGLVFLLA